MLRTKACLPALLLLACSGTSSLSGRRSASNDPATAGTGANPGAGAQNPDPAAIPPAAPSPTPLPTVAPGPVQIPLAPTPTPTPIGPAPSPGFTWTSEPYGSDTRLAAIWGASATDIYAVGAAGVIVHSRGDGVWSPLASGCQDDLHAIWGASAREIYAVGAIAQPSWSGSVLRSTDGGQSWILTRNAGSLHAAVWGASGEDLYIADYHALYHSTDHGGSWGRIDLGLASAYALFGGAKQIFAGGDQRNQQLVLHSADGFASFAAVEPGSSDGILGLGGTGAGDLWAVGAPGRVYHSVDEGATFADLTPTGDVPGLTGVFSATAGDVWVVGNGVVFHTSDGGHSWTRPTLPSSGSFSAVWGSSAHDIFIVGGGAILHGQG